ncbi:MAG: lactonase family protein [Ruminococcaceae bacterium]|nr:lactonase family protein [Oscillospiraceae bacterium]
MFKLMTLVLAVMMIAACAVNAGEYDDVFANLTLSEFALYEQGTLDAVQLRAFAVDPNGKYYYGGLLNSGTPTVYQFDAATGDPVCTYQFDPSEDPGAYIKALAADDRGYVYMGVANKANNGAVYFAICSQDGLAEIKWVKIEIEGKVGVNGACVREVNGKYYLYFITNYESDRLYCYDVTDVNNPTVFNAFGSDGFSSGGGYLDLTSGFGMQDANNIAIDEQGYIYICATTGVGSKGDTIFKVSADGTGIVGQASVSECFGVAILGNGYLATCTYEGADSKLHILNQQDLSPVTVIGYDNANNFTQLGMIGNKIYMADQGPDAVLVSSEINFPAPVEPEVPEVPAEGGETDAPAAPTTADTGLVAASVLLLAAAAVVLKARKH